MVMHWNEFYKENEMIEVGQALVAKRFFNQNYTSFHSHYHHLIPATKRAENVN